MTDQFWQAIRRQQGMMFTQTNYDPTKHVTLGNERAMGIARELAVTIRRKVVEHDLEYGHDIEALQQTIYDVIEARLIGEVNVQGGLSALFDTRFANAWQVQQIIEIEKWRYEATVDDLKVKARPHITVIGSMPIRVDIQVVFEIYAPAKDGKQPDPLTFTTGSHVLDFPVWSTKDRPGEGTTQLTYESWFRRECMGLIERLRLLADWNKRG